jgi:hypothetical protein
MAQKLKKFQVHKVSIVPYGANDETIQLHKSADSDEVVLFKSADYEIKDKGDISMKSILKEGEAPPSEEKKEEKKEEEEKKEGEEETAKSAPVQKCEEGDKKKAEEKEQETQKSALFKEFRSEIKKAVDEAVAPLRQENAVLRKSLDGEQVLRETREYIAKAATELPNLGNAAEVGSLLLAIEKSNLSKEDKGRVQTFLKQADTGSAYLFKAQGYSRRVEGADTGSLVGEFNQLVKDKMGEIRKNVTGKVQRSELVLKSMAEAAVSKERPDLARAVISAERADAARQQQGGY